MFGLSKNAEESELDPLREEKRYLG